MKRVMMKRVIITIAAVLCSAIAFCQRELSLQECKDLAIQNSIHIKNSALETEAAKQVKKDAHSNYFPKVTATAFAFQSADKIIHIDNPGGNLPVYDGNPQNIPAAEQFAFLPPSFISILDKGLLGAVNVVQPVYTGGQIVNGNKLARLGLQVKEDQQTITRNEILLKTEQQYWEIVSLQEKQKTLAQYDQLLTGLYEQVRDSYNSGLIVKNDVLKVQIRKHEVQVSKNKLKNGRQLALMRFCQTIGIPYDSALLLSVDHFAPEKPEYYYIPVDTALPNRAEYRLLQKSLEAKQLERKLKRANLHPKVAVGATGYYMNAMDNGGVTNGLLFVTIDVPLSNFWSRSPSLSEQDIKVQIEANNVVENRQLLRLQMQKAWIDLTEAYAQIELAEKIEEESLENVKQNTDSYKSGLVTFSNVLEAHALLLEASNKLIEAKSNYQTAITNYLQIMGQQDGEYSLPN